MTSPVKLRFPTFKKLHDDATIPERSAYADGFVLKAYLIGENKRPIKRLIPVGNTMIISTGVEANIPPNYIVRAVPDLALKSVFPIMLDHAGENQPLYVLMYNGYFQSFYVEHDMAIAQLVSLGG